MDTLLWYVEITLDYLRQMLPCMLAAVLVFLCLRPWRYMRLEVRGMRSGVPHEAALLIFVLFCVGLAALTLFPATFWTVGHWRAVFLGYEPLFRPVDWYIQLHTIQFIPLRTISGGFGGPWVFFMMLGNLAMFIPLGFFPALLWQGESWRRALLTGLCSSLGVEVIQFFIGRGSDIDDIILNTLGTLCGWWIFLLLRRIMPNLLSKFRCVKVESLHV